MYNSPFVPPGMSGFGAMGNLGPASMMGAAGAKRGLGGLLGSLFGRGAATSAAAGAVKQGLNWGSILGNTQKTLGIVNQAIPIFYQVGPIFNNAKTMFKIADAMRTPDTPAVESIQTTEEVIKEEVKHQYNASNQNDNRPIFFL